MISRKNAIPGVLALFILLGAGAPREATAQESFSPEALAQIEAVLQEKATWTPTQRKMGSKLILASKRRLGRNVISGVPESRSRLRTADDGNVLVDIDATVTQDVLNAITQLGGEIIASVPQFDSIRAAIPVEALETIAGHSDIRFIREADRFMTNMINVSEGDGAHRADEARANFGVDGTGVNVGVMSDGVDSLITLQGSGDLPPGVTVLPGQSGSGSEGTAMLEIVFDLAPGAGLFFATAFNGQASFAQNILNLQAAGCQVIVDDIFYFAEPVFQDGIIAQAVETAAANGVSYFSSAGNAGNLNDGTAGVFEGDFNGVSVTLPNGTFTAHDYGFMTTSNLITADAPFVFTLHWADPIGASSNDYDLFLFDFGLTTLLDASTNAQTGFSDPYEQIFSFGFNDTNNRLVVVKNSGEDRFFHLNTLRGQLNFATDGQTSGHSTTDNSFGVAAVSVFSAPGPPGTPFDGTEPVEFFSSDGPRRVFYEADGTPITPGNFSSTGGAVRNKPDLTAADGVSTATPGFGTFFGTSAAAPHAAALAALLIDFGIFTTPDEVRATLTGTAIDIEAPGMDRDSGYGIVDINAALDVDCGFALNPPSALVSADGVVGALINFGANPACPWTAVSNAPFITITSGASGTGPGVIQYTVAPNNGAGRIGTITAGTETFTVTQAACALPAVAINPVSQAGCLGGNVTFSAAGTGTTPLNIEWQVNQGPGFMKIPGETGPTLTINNITQDMDGYQYHAIFYNVCGEATSAPAVLTVGQPGSASAVSASDGTFADRVRVQWNAAPGATSYRVFRSENSNASGAIDISGPITDTFFDDLTATTGPGTGCNPQEVAIVYTYFVIASNPCGAGNASATDKGSIADPAKLSASLRPENAGDFALLLLTLAAMYGYQRRRKLAAMRNA